MSGPSASPDPAPPAGSDRGAFAAVDCGSNSTRLLVLADDGRQLVRLMRITRLGQGVDASGVLDPAAVARTVAVLEDYRKVLDKLCVRAVRMAATSAVRDAANGHVFLDAATRAIGVPAELLSGDEEGRLAYAGATSGLHPDDGNDVDGAPLEIVLDIGGGSTELIAGCGDASAPSRSVEPAAVSLDLGCVRLTERFFHHDPPLPEEQAACHQCIAAELDRAARTVPALEPGAAASGPEGSEGWEGSGRSGRSRRLIGLAGTVSTLSRLEQGLTDYDWGKVHHSVLDAAEVEHWCRTLAAERASERARRPGMVEGRQDVIAAGAFVLGDVMRRFAFERCLVSETDILDGLAASLREPPASSSPQRAP